MSALKKYSIPDFSRGTWDSGEIISRIGPGEIGGKASGLVLLAREFLAGLDHAEFPEFKITIPRLVVLGTGVFESFMEMNDLWGIAFSGASEERLANAFLRASLPPEILGDLRDFISQVDSPLAVRSSSLLEDALDHPFAGVYSTKMIPNNQPDLDTRYQRLDEAVRFIYATTFFNAARNYFKGSGQDHSRERMAVVIQEVVGNRHDQRFYPEISGVCRSFNYYPTGSATPTDGVVNLALGLGRQIVDGGLSWGYCPAYPASPPPFNDVGDRLRSTQTTFWSVNMGTPPPPDPMGETEFLLEENLTIAEDDEVLDHLVSTYDSQSDRLRLGLSGQGPRVLDFGPILVGETLALNKLVTRMLPLAERTAGCPVEMEFAVDRQLDGTHRVCLLQMRPMVIPEGESKVSPVEMKDAGVVLASESALGHGTKDNIQDIVFLKPETFDIGRSRAVAAEVETFNNELLAAGKPYILIGFGRWGSSDPWLGVPVDWGQLSGAKVIVEAPFRDLNPDPSQGAHFFHNLISFGVFYLTVRNSGSSRVDWDWLNQQTVARDGRYLRHVKLDRPVQVRVDGLAGLGLVKVGGSIMKATEKLLGDLKERAKELSCLYEVETFLNQGERPLAEVMADVVEVIGGGWQFPDYCVAAITIEEETWKSKGFEESPCKLATEIKIHDETVGEIRVYYTQKCPEGDTGPFLKEEVRLIESLAERMSHYILFKKIQKLGKKWRELDQMSEGPDSQNWQVVIDLLRETDDSLFVRISRKMLNFLCSIGITEAQTMLGEIDLDFDPLETGSGEVNVPGERLPTDRSLLLTGKPFELAARFITGEEIIFYVQKWIQADKASSFLNVLDNPRSTLSEVQDALRRFQLSAPDGAGLPDSTMKSLRVSLTQRILTEQLDFVQTAKNHVDVSFFRNLMDRIVMPTVSHGKLGGKAAGMLLAHCILQRSGMQIGQEQEAGPTDTHLVEILSRIKIPKTWHIASDAPLDFIAYNDLEDVLHQKYKPIDEVRRDYPNIIRLFKNSSFPPSLVQGLSAALDEFEGIPLVVRSSSLLEDRVGTAFSGKYKSLFLANQGTKKECMDALLDAVAEIYASMFGPDPIEYRTERGVLEFDEQMGILIQEVVGTRVGKYFFPAFAGVAFSKNEFRWSPRIKREDGLVRLVPGLGTRAVDRTSDDYPVLIVPGQPELRVNVALDEVIRYSPSMMDVINLETNSFQTVKVDQILKDLGGKYPGLPLVFSILRDGRLIKPVSIMLDPEKEDLYPTFDGLRQDSDFLPQIRGLLEILEDTLNTPVDVEFAHDGKDLYLLQCRPQSQADVAAPAPIPQDIPHEDIVFSANKFVSNGRMEDIKYLVYVDPERYGALESRDEMKAVGRAVSRLNKLLPRKQFVLMGPGRWGSRGDITLGVNVSYGDINNTAMLIEIARQKGSYVPDVSFGTHFFQDLVEAGIGYLPLYPDEEGNHFSDRFLLGSDNIFGELVPKYAELADTIRVIDVKKATDGRILKILLNADLDQAVACLSEPDLVTKKAPVAISGQLEQPIQYWLWRKQMAERIAREVDHRKLGVEAMYLIGSVKNAIAGPASDIDLLIHFTGTPQNRAELMNWLDGWSRCLDEVNYLKTGYRTKGLLDVHVVTDEDIAKRSSFAVKIGAVTDAAYGLPLSEK